MTTSTPFRDLLHSARYDMGPTVLLPLRRKKCWVFFRPKNPTASAGFEPSNSDTRGQHSYPYTTEAVHFYNMKDKIVVRAHFTEIVWNWRPKWILKGGLYLLRWGQCADNVTKVPPSCSDITLAAIWWTLQSVVGCMSKTSTSILAPINSSKRRCSDNTVLRGIHERQNQEATEPTNYLQNEGPALNIGTTQVTEKSPMFIESDGALPCLRISPLWNHPTNS